MSRVRNLKTRLLILDSQYWRLLAIIAGLWSFAVVQPLFDLIGKNPQFLALHYLQSLDLILLVAILVLAAPLGLWLIILLIGLGNDRARNVATWLTSGLLLGMALRPLGNDLPLLPGWLQIVTFLLIGLGLSWQVGRSRRISRHLGLLGLASLLVVGFFFLQPEPRYILFPPDPQPRSSSADSTTDSPDDQTPVVLVVMDAFSTISLVDSDWNIDASLCPNLARFSEDAVWYRNALAIHDDTTFAVPSILTGCLPRPGSAPTFAWHPDNLFTWLRDTHRIEAFESHTVLDERKIPAFRDRMSLVLADLRILYLHVLLPADLANGLPSISNTWWGFADQKDHNEAGETRFPSVQQLSADFKDTLAKGNRAGCYFLHTLVPHTPYVYLPSGNMYSITGEEPSGEGKQWGNWLHGLWPVVLSQQRHLLQVGYADRLMGEILDRLVAEGIYDESLVIITADHGMSFRPDDGRRQLTPTNQGQILPVPLLIKYPGRASGTIDDRPVQLVDIVPTIASVLGTRLPWSHDGISLLDPNYAGVQTISFLDGDDSREIAVGDILAQREVGLRQKLRRFGSHMGEAGLFTPFRGSELWGTPVSRSLPKTAEVKVDLQTPVLLVVPDPETDLIPAEVVGYLTNSEPFSDHQDIAVSVDGVIRAVTHPYDRPPGSDLGIFTTMLPEAHLGEGEHQVGIYLVDWSGQEPVLFALQSEEF